MRGLKQMDPFLTTGLRSRSSISHWHRTNSMKVQSGLLHLEGRVITSEDVDLLASGLPALQAEIDGIAIDGPLLMRYRGQCITPEEDFETQPYRLGPYILTWDGRLDNR